MILGVFIEFFGVKIVIGLSKNRCDLFLAVGFFKKDGRNLDRWIKTRKKSKCQKSSKIIVDKLPINRRFFQFIIKKSATFPPPDTLPGACSVNAEKSTKYWIFSDFCQKIRYFSPIFLHPIFSMDISIHSHRKPINRRKMVEKTDF